MFELEQPTDIFFSGICIPFEWGVEQGNKFLPQIVEI